MKDACILITGGAGFIGSVLAGYLSRQGYNNIAIVDRFNNPAKLLNLEGKSITQKIESTDLFDYLEKKTVKPDFIFHFGARIETLKADYSGYENQHIDFSQRLWDYAVKKAVPFVYASSAATYGNDDDVSDDENHLASLRPAGGYGRSKHAFDLWAVQQQQRPPCWAGLKFFNVYGPNEYHKAGRSSMVFRCFNEAKENGAVRLFGSHKPSINDGGHLRDFIYVTDVVKVCSWFLHRWQSEHTTGLSGIYNVGTAIPRSYNDLAYTVFENLNLPVSIIYEPIPENIRGGYKDVICSNIEKLRKAGYADRMYTLEEGVGEYIEYLNEGKYY